MTAVHAAAPAGASQQAAVDAALVLLERMGLSPADLLAAARDRPDVPTFAEYVPVVPAAVSAGTRRAYGSYWNRVIDHWGGRHLDEVTPSEIRRLMTYVKTHVVARRNARGGRSAAEHLVAAGRGRGPAYSASRWAAEGNRFKTSFVVETLRISRQPERLLARVLGGTWRECRYPEACCAKA